ncbi:MAG: FkbM family methyltransferase [Planctomycetes bacterium]|nr:FkbM family methyltransferase [Planctomycetota bacterium]
MLAGPRPASFREASGRLMSFLFRMKDIARAARVFGEACPGQPDVLARALFGYRMHLDVRRSRAQQLVYLMGERAIPESRIVVPLLRSGMRALDVGANIGYWTLLLRSAVGDDGYVVAYEPSPENLPELRLNVGANALTNVRVRPVAVGAGHGTVSFRSGINGGVSTDGSGMYQCPIVPLDEISDERIDFIKIDVEGFEGAVLEGALGLIRRHRPILWIEYHPRLAPGHGLSYLSLLEHLGVLYADIALFVACEALKRSGLRRIASRYGWGDRLVGVPNPNSASAQELVRGESAVWVCARRRREAT